MKFKQAGIFLYHAVQEVKEVKWEGETGYSGSHICLCPPAYASSFLRSFLARGQCNRSKVRCAREQPHLSLSSPLSLPLSLSLSLSLSPSLPPLSLLRRMNRLACLEGGKEVHTACVLRPRGVHPLELLSGILHEMGKK